MLTFQTINVLENNSHLNYRTLIFAFEKFDEICTEVIRHSFEIDSDALSSFLKAAYFYTLELAIKHKTGGYIHHWTESEEFGKVKTSDDKWSYNSMLGFKFIHDFVLYSSLNSQSIKQVVNEYIEYLKNTDASTEHKITELRNTWFKSSDTELRNSIIEIDELIDTNRVNLFQLLEMLALRMELNSIGFQYDIELFVDKISEKVVECKEDELQYNSHQRNYVPKNLSEPFKMYKSQILDTFNSVNEVNKVENLNSFLNGTTEKMNQFYDYVRSNDNEFRKKGLFLGLLDLDIFIDCLIKSQSVGIYIMTETISRIYSEYGYNTAFKNDRDFIVNAVKRLEEVKVDEYNFDNIKTYNWGVLIEQLKSYSHP